eukprot:793484-Prymnesium_polylepis.1
MPPSFEKLVWRFARARVARCGKFEHESACFAGGGKRQKFDTDLRVFVVGVDSVPPKSEESCMMFARNRRSDHTTNLRSDHTTNLEHRNVKFES